MTFSRLLRIGVKAALIFLVLDYAFGIFVPMDAVGRLTAYGWLTPHRVRLPYGADIAPYNAYVTNLPAMFASHIVSRPPADDEFRVVLLGDSGAWGWWLPPDDILSAAMTDLAAERDLRIDGRRIVAYNLAYPNMSLTKDVLILDEAMRHDPDLIVWLVTLNSFAPSEQMDSGIVFDNPTRARQLIACCGLPIAADHPLFRPDGLLERSIAGQRRDLSTLIRYQLSGFAWAATGRDLIIPDSITRVSNDYAADDSWKSFPDATTLTTDDLAFHALTAGQVRAGAVPLWIANAPTYRGDGTNSDIRYSLWYPRWAYDQYRDLLAAHVADAGLPYRDLWDTIAPVYFTDSPAHLNAAGTYQLADLLLGWLVEP